MESIKNLFETRNIHRKQHSVTTKLLATLLVSSLILLVSCGSQSNTGSSGDTSTPTSKALQTIHMINATTGWATTQNTVLRTIDRGVHWKVVAPPGNPLIASMDATFLTGSTAWIGISQANSSTILVFRTEDGGQTWQQSSAHTTISTQIQMSAIDSQHGWILNHIGGGPQAEIVEIFRTSDGGKNWARVTQVYPASTDGPPPGRLPYGGSKSGLSFVNATTGWVTGSVPVNNLTWVYVTRDGGSSWQQQALPPAPHLAAAQLSFLTATFFTARDGILPVNFVGDKGSGFGVYVTHDGGNTWKGVTAVQPPSSMAAIDFIDMNHGWVVDKDGGNLYATKDGGQHWTKLAFRFTSSSAPSLKLLDFVTSKIGWAIGATPDTTVLFKTVDGGHTWSPVPYTIS